MSVCTLTPAAEAQIDKLCEENEVYGVSLNLKGGGCAGFEYDWDFVKTPEDLQKDDEVIKTTEGKCAFVIGGTSLMFLFGTELDYVKSIVGSNFEIKNPNAKSSCGCGISVNFDMEKIGYAP
tara:strand:- start:710 stop:1075 length:366 start_codon:yes stop_codon:yes gene_type:complete